MVKKFDSPYKQFNLPSIASSKAKQEDSDFDNLALQWTLDPTPKNKSAIMGKLQPVIKPHLSQYGNNPLITGQAKLLAINAMGSYDPAKGSLRSHIGSAMQGLQRQAAQMNQMIDIPERVAIESEKLREAENMLEGDLGRPPSDLELSGHLGMSAKRLGYIRKLRRPTNNGKFTDEDGAVYTPDGVNSGDDTLGDIWQELVYHDLQPHDQVIMEHTLGLNGKPILENRQLADKLRLSPGAISQRKQRIQNMLDERTN